MTFGSILEWLGTWTGIISTIITSTGVIFIAFKKIMKKLQPHLEILENLQKLTKTVNEINGQFQKNGGGSLKDSVVELSQNVKANTEIVKNIENTQTWLLDTNPIPMFQSDETGKCSYVNSSYCQMLGRTKEELLGNGWKNCLVQEKRQEVFNEWSACVAEERAFERVIDIEDKSGKRYTVKVNAQRTSAGKFLGTWTNIRST